ncbi:MAG: PorT family protein [Cyclobacteriaceae bacterium]
MRALIIITCLFVSLGISAQRFKGPNPAQPYSVAEEFLDTQWWLGLKFGGNLSGINVLQSYNGFSPMDYDPALLDKEYSQYQLFGGQAGLDVTYYHRGFSIGFQPNYRVHRYGYSNEFVWTGTNSAYQTDYSVDQKIDLIEFPVYVKYDIIRSAVRPYAMLGASYALVLRASKTVLTESSNTGSTPIIPLESGSTTLGNKDNFKSLPILIGGIGLSIDKGNIRTVLEASYRQAIGNIIQTENRFEFNEHAGIGDTMDDLALNNINLTISVLFPLRFISSQFTSTR